jgi:hypothetical protein|nr:MAG TPA: hypothetical protein [Caudoviricetes sp.]DAT57628.1 MAG TPA: hypothetical protein [Caudoviricetes sp.]
MIMSEINVNIVETTIKSNRTPLSLLGGRMFGQDVFIPQTRMFNPDHDKVLEQAKQGSNVNLVLNRSPRRFAIGYITIESMATKQNAIGDVVCRLNEGTEHQIDIPLGENSTKFGETTEEAVQNALKDKNSKAVFSDPKDLSGILNDLNRGEIARLEAIIEQANKAKAQCLSAIAANEKIVADYERQKADSKPADKIA